MMLPFETARRVHPALAVLLLASLGCKVGPDFKPPVPPAPSEYGAAPLPAATSGDAQRFLRGGKVDPAWWKAFGSPALDRRVERALARNPTVASAQAALRRAQEASRAAGASLLPTADLQAGVQRQKLGPGYGVYAPFTVYAATVNVSYALDLFGGARRQVEGLLAREEAQAWILRGTYLTLASNVAGATIREASLRGRIEAARDIVGLLDEQVSLTEKLVSIGARSQADLLALQSQRAAARAQLPPLSLELETVRNQLAVYLGDLPSEAGLDAVGPGDLKLPPELPVSLPGDVVRARPDVQAALAQLHAATADVGNAKAALFPQITLGASYGPQTLSSGDLLKSGNAAWSVSAGILQPIFHGGALRARKRGAEAALDQALADYRGTLLGAFADVSNALVAVQADAEAQKAQEDFEAAASRSLDLVKGQYRIGAASYLQLLDATRTWHQARAAAIQARAARLSDTTALYAALGGGLQE